MIDLASKRGALALALVLAVACDAPAPPPSQGPGPAEQLRGVSTGRALSARPRAKPSHPARTFWRLETAPDASAAASSFEGYRPPDAEDRLVVLVTAEATVAEINQVLQRLRAQIDEASAPRLPAAGRLYLRLGDGLRASDLIEAIGRMPGVAAVERHPRYAGAEGDRPAEHSRLEK